MSKTLLHQSSQLKSYLTIKEEKNKHPFRSYKMAVFIKASKEVFTLTSKLFSDINKVTNFTNLSDLEKALIGPIFQEFAPLLRLYSQYLTSYNEVSEIFNEAVAVTLLEKWSQQDPRCAQEGIFGFLMLPLLRIDHYVEHLKDINTYTEETHADKVPLTNAIDSMSKTVVSLKEMIQEAQEKNKLESLYKKISGFRANLVRLEDGTTHKIHHQGNLTLFSNEKGTKDFFFVFIDKIMISCRFVSELTSASNMEYGETFSPLDTFPLVPEAIPNYPNSFAVVCEEETLLLCAESKSSRNIWLRKLTLHCESLGHESKARKKLKTAAIWEGDEKSDACKICNKVFNLIIRRHVSAFLSFFTRTLFSSKNLNFLITYSIVEDVDN